METTPAQETPDAVTLNFPAPADTALRAILGTQFRTLLKVLGSALVTRGLVDQGTVDGVLPALSEELAGGLLLAGASVWSVLRAFLSHSRWAAAWAALQTPSTNPTPAPASKLSLLALANPNGFSMSLKSTLLHAIGAIAGILIPGASPSTAELTHSVQQHIADAFGPAATKMAAELKVDATGMSGPDKVFAITRALVATAQSQGFKGDLKVLGDVVLDIAQAAYRATESSIGADIVALAAALHAGPALTVVAELVSSVVQDTADRAVSAAA